MLATARSGGAQYVVRDDHQLLRFGGCQGLLILSVRAFMDTLPGLLAAERAGKGF